MTLAKSIAHGKDHRAEYRGSKRFDKSCRNHGSCPACEGTRLRWRKVGKQLDKEAQA